MPVKSKQASRLRANHHHCRYRRRPIANLQFPLPLPGHLPAYCGRGCFRSRRKREIRPLHYRDCPTYGSPSWEMASKRPPKVHWQWQIQFHETESYCLCCCSWRPWPCWKHHHPPMQQKCSPGPEDRTGEVPFACQITKE